MLRYFALAITALTMCPRAESQSDIDQTKDSASIIQISPKYLDKVSSKAEQIEHKLNGQTEKMLWKMQREEGKLNEMLAKIDSNAAKKLFAQSERKYTELLAQLKSQARKLDPNNLGTYMPYLDTLKTALRFLEAKGNNLVGQSSEVNQKLNDAISKVNILEGKLATVNSIQQYLKERAQYLKEQLGSFGLVSHLKRINKEVYYYSQFIDDYKEAIKDPQRLEAKAIAILREIPAFKKFMQNNSQLASVFNFSPSSAGAVSFAGLQTRASVQQAIAALPINNANSQQFIRQQLQTANQQLSQQKNPIRLPGLDGAREDLGFKPNHQRTKPFRKRIEFGANFQFGQVNQFLPSTSEVAVTIGYKLSDEGTIGIGSSYKLGLGSGFNHIHFSHQGFGFRSYIDWKIKGGIYVSGGYEKNNLPQLTTIDAPMQLGTWQESGLIGMTKKYPLRKRKGYVQLLFDFLSYKNIPRSRPILVRTGINF